MALKDTTKETKEKPKKEIKKMKKLNFETIKTVVIAVLITGIVTFIGTQQYDRAQNEQLKAEASSIVKSIRVEATVAPSK